jgi:hypothetical protein
MSGRQPSTVRLWSLHPKYLDPQGLVALWREALLAQAVLQGNTRGYKAHPQLERFQAQRSAVAAIGSYLLAVHSEACTRGYSFDRAKIAVTRSHKTIVVTAGQVQYEWQHLMGKLAIRNPELHQRWRSVQSPQCHPLFQVHAGEVETWERRHGDG